MIFRIKRKHEVGFKLWLQELGYTMRELSDGSSTFNGIGAKKSLSYALLRKDLTGNSACQVLFNEYEEHLNNPDYLEVKVA